MSADKIRELEPSELRRRCDPADLKFQTTDDLEPLSGMLGQPRVEAAIEFGAEIERDGYNIFAFGPPGTGKTYWAEVTARDLAAYARYGKTFDELLPEQQQAIIGDDQSHGVGGVYVFRRRAFCFLRADHRQRRTDQ